MYMCTTCFFNRVEFAERQRSNLNWPLKNLVGPSFRFHNEYMVVVFDKVGVSLTPHHTKSHIVGHLASILIFHLLARPAPYNQRDCIVLLVPLVMSEELASIPFSLVVVSLMVMRWLKQTFILLVSFCVCVRKKRDSSRELQFEGKNRRCGRMCKDHVMCSD